MVPNKGLYMAKDLSLLASYMNVPLRPPSDPFEVMFNKGSKECPCFYHSYIHIELLYCKLLHAHPKPVFINILTAQP